MAAGHSLMCQEAAPSTKSEKENQEKTLFWFSFFFRTSVAKLPWKANEHSIDLYLLFDSSAEETLRKAWNTVSMESEEGF